MKINEIIRKERRLRGITLPELSERSGVSKGLLSKLENDEESNPTLVTLQKIALIFGESVSLLLEELD